ncbi:NETI motif-containing protein [Staphylococcus sp. GDY8P120P]|uniref:NETI motif-containing protein n=1 Tax=Staphylococcus sp. GDY8P120P TaxID=2804156 RepID=UPI001AEBF0CC|nr:NETI motif-containing protein [Staphylococcus sp. GDY8P120P]
MKKQQKFKVGENETIQDCLKRMRDAGYMPVKRLEKPIYKENKNGTYEVYRQEIQFVGKLQE